jgi:DNA mismatch repair ATPase MutS
MTSIGRGDSLLGGKSHYFAEVERLKTFVELGASGGGRLFLIDEIFRGTNTVERVAAAAAVLEHLSERNTVMTTTHDIELQEFLDGRYRTVHFSEQVSGDRFYFDYLMKDGPARSRNAIALLKLSG